MTISITIVLVYKCSNNVIYSKNTCIYIMYLHKNIVMDIVIYCRKWRVKRPSVDYTSKSICNLLCIKNNDKDDV